MYYYDEYYCTHLDYSAVEIIDESFKSNDLSHGERVFVKCGSTKKPEELPRSASSWWGRKPEKPQPAISLMRNGMEQYIHRSIVFNPKHCSCVVNPEAFQLALESEVSDRDILSPWRVFSTHGVNFENTNHSLKFDGENPQRTQKLRIQLDQGKERGLLQLIATMNLDMRQPNKTVTFKKGSLFNLFVSRSTKPVIYPYVTITPKTSQVFVPIEATQVVNIVLPYGSSAEMVEVGKNTFFSKGETSKSLPSHSESLCHFYTCFCQLVRTVVFHFHSSMPLLNKYEYGAILFVPCMTWDQQQFAVIQEPIGAFTFIKNQSDGFILRTTNRKIGDKRGFFDKTKKLKILRSFNVYDPHTQKSTWEMFVKCDLPEIVVQNIDSDDCEVI